MKAVLVLPHRLIRTQKGNYYYRGAAIIPERYLEVFDRLELVARVESIDVDEISGKQPLNHSCLDVCELPYYVGPIQYLIKRRQLRASMKELFMARMKAKSAFILQVPSTESGVMADYLIPNEIPYGVEVAGSARDTARSLQGNILQKKALEFFGHTAQRKQCRHAAAAVYVTQEYLQRLCPCHGWSLSCPNVILHEEAFISQQTLDMKLSEAKEAFEKKRPFRIVHVASMDVPYKGQDILLEAVKKCQERNINLQVNFAGDGKYRKRIEQKAEDLKLDSMVTFCGLLPAEQIRNLLDESDAFIFPTFSEGLPRVIMEAMARGLPCISTTVAGIPELIESEFLVPARNSTLLAGKMCTLLTDYAKFSQAARDNLRNGQQYAYEILRAKRRQFYDRLKEITAIHYRMS